MLGPVVAEPFCRRGWAVHRVFAVPGARLGFVCCAVGWSWMSVWCWIGEGVVAGPVACIL